ncbi:MAG: 4-hydroxy-tetrahydrodipicolinate synthase [Ignavibacteriales bacterium]|nr:4-hydroxy-tetrahydrodipicolinate synthase [Ignavibacteriales bacterium]
MAQTKKFRGTGTAIVTPFKKDGTLDADALRRLVDFQIKGGVEAIVPAGTTGENPTLSLEEHYSVVDLVLEQAGGRVKVFAGAGSNDTQKAVELARHAKAAGADAALVVGPYYNKPTQEGYFRHYRTIAEAADFPVIVYNVPGRTGGNIEASTILRIAEQIPNVVAVKEASGNMAQIMEIARNKPEDFSLLSGDDAFTLPLMSVGGDGCISVVANETPHEFSDLVRACLKGHWQDALELHNKLLPLMNANFLESNPIPVKSALAMMGMIEESFRLPMVPISEKNRDKLKQILIDLKLV